MGPRIAIYSLTIAATYNLALGRKNEKKATPIHRRFKFFLSLPLAAFEQI